MHPKFLGAVPELKHTSLISGRQYFYMRFLDFFHLSVQDLHRQLILGNVVNSRTAATLICALDLDKLDSRNCLSLRARLCSDPLPMVEVTRIIISDTPV